MKIINSFLLALKASSVDAFKLFLLKVLELSATTATSIVLVPASSSFYSLTSLRASSVIPLLNSRKSLTIFRRGQFILSVLVTDLRSRGHTRRGHNTATLLFSLLLCFGRALLHTAPFQHQRHRRQHQRRRTDPLVLGAAPLPLLSPEQH